MSDAELDPHVLISARIGNSRRMLALPSHHARFGWIVMLGQASEQSPPGSFPSRTVMASSVGWHYREFFDAYEAAGLTATDAAGAIHVVDWHAHYVPTGRLPISADLRAWVALAFNGRCAYCGTVDGPMHVDHHVPVARGGTNDPLNLVLACQPCNLAKSDRDPVDWPIRFGRA